MGFRCVYHDGDQEDPGDVLLRQRAEVLSKICLRRWTDLQPEQAAPDGLMDWAKREQREGERFFPFAAMLPPHAVVRHAANALCTRRKERIYFPPEARTTKRWFRFCRIPESYGRTGSWDEEGTQ